MSTLFQVARAPGSYLFPFRTEKSSPVAPMVLQTRGRVGRRHFQRESSELTLWRLFFCALNFYKEIKDLKGIKDLKVFKEFKETINDEKPNRHPRGM